MYSSLPSLTPTSSIDSPGRSGMSRYAPLKSPEKSNVICSRTSSDPSDWIFTATSASGSEYDFALPIAGQTSAGAAMGGGCAGEESCCDPAQLENCTDGASRAAPSVSKYACGAKLKSPATRFVGTVSSALSYVSTASL